MTCNECKRVIGATEEFCQQDKTGFRLCLDCADCHTDVTMCAPAGCSCSRGGRAMYCECREELREAEGLAAFANDPTAAYALIDQLQGKIRANRGPK